MSRVLSYGELRLKQIKQEADFYKTHDKESSDVLYDHLKKSKIQLQKLSLIQGKIKRMR